MINLLNKKNDVLLSNDYYYFSDKKIDIPLAFIEKGVDVIQFKTNSIYLKESSDNYVKDSFNVYQGSFIINFLKNMKIHKNSVLIEADILNYLERNLYYKTKYLPIPIETFEMEADYLDKNIIYYGISYKKYVENLNLREIDLVKNIRYFVLFENEEKIPEKLDPRFEFIVLENLEKYFGIEENYIIFSEETIAFKLEVLRCNIKLIKYFDFNLKSLVLENKFNGLKKSEKIVGALVSDYDDYKLLKYFMDMPIEIIEQNIISDAINLLMREVQK